MGRPLPQIPLGSEGCSLEPVGPWLPLAQNNPHTTETHLGVTRSELLQKLTWRIKGPSGQGTLVLRNGGIVGHGVGGREGGRLQNTPKPQLQRGTWRCPAGATSLQAVEGLEEGACAGVGLTAGNFSTGANKREASVVWRLQLPPVPSVSAV